MNILSLNGGGILGYSIASLLERLENELGKPCYEIFDFITGVSTGSIVGGAISLGYTAKEVKDLYKELGGEIFKNPRWFLTTLFKSKYDIENLEKTIKNKLGENKLLFDCKVKFMCNSLVINKGEPYTKYWKSWKEQDSLVPIYKCMCASSAAPSYFDPYSFDNTLYIDGAFSENNPTMSSIAECLRLGSSLSEIKCLNINPIKGYGLQKADQFRGLLNVLKHLASFFIVGSDDANTYQADKLLNSNYIYVPSNTWAPIDTLDFNLFETVAQNMWENKKLHMLSVLK